MRKNVWFLFAAVYFSGCLSLAQTGYLSDYENLKRADAYSKAFLNPDYAYHAGQTLTVAQPELARDLEIESYQQKMLADYLKQSLEAQIQEKGLYTVVPDGGDLELETHIGKLNPGNGFLRWFFGFGFGRSDIQVEARLKESAGDKLAASYAYRRHDAGNPVFGLNMSELDNDNQMQKAMGEVAKSFTKFLEKKLDKD